jgi:hypothetical protein
VELHFRPRHVRRRQRARPVLVPPRAPTTSRPKYNYSDRDQRHRFNAWLLVTAAGFGINNRVSSRTAQPRSIGETPQDRIQPDGTILKRNTLHKDNEFFTWDLRVSRPFKAGGASIEPIFEIFNITKSRNIRRPEVTNLIFPARRSSGSG